MSKRKHTPSDSPRQLSIFEPQFDSRIRREEIDGVTYFSILDVFQFQGSEGSSDSPSKYWSRAKKRLIDQGSNVPGLVDWRPAAQQGGKPTPMITLKLFLRVAQVVEIKEWEAIRDWMAEIAHERIEEVANPELGIQRARARARLTYQSRGQDTIWIDQRLKGIDQRNWFTDVLNSVITEPNYGAATNHVYVELYELTARELRKALNISDKANIRDHLPALALSYIGIAEILIADQLKATGETLTWLQAESIIINFARLVGEQVQATSQRIGRNLATNTPLLKG